MDRAEIAKELTVAALQRMELSLGDERLGVKIAGLYRRVYDALAQEPENDGKPGGEGAHYSRLNREDLLELFRQAAGESGKPRL